MRAGCAGPPCWAKRLIVSLFSSGTQQRAVHDRYGLQAAALSPARFGEVVPFGFWRLTILLDLDFSLARKQSRIQFVV